MPNIRKLGRPTHSKAASEGAIGQQDPSRMPGVAYYPFPMVQGPPRFIPIPMSMVNGIPVAWFPEPCMQPLPPNPSNTRQRYSLGIFGGYPSPDTHNPPVQNPQSQYALRRASWGHSPPVALPNGRNSAANYGPQQVPHQYVGDAPEGRRRTRERTISHGQIQRHAYPFPRAHNPPPEQVSSPRTMGERTPSVVSISSDEEEPALPPNPPMPPSSEEPPGIRGRDFMSRVLDDGVRDMPVRNNPVRALPRPSNVPVARESRTTAQSNPAVRLQHRKVPSKSVGPGIVERDALGLKLTYPSGETYRIFPKLLAQQGATAATRPEFVSTAPVPAQALPGSSSSVASMQQRPLAVDPSAVDLQQDQAEGSSLRWKAPMTVDLMGRMTQALKDGESGGEATADSSKADAAAAVLTPGPPMIALQVQLADDKCPIPGCSGRLGTTKSSCITHMKNYHFFTKFGKNYKGPITAVEKVYDMKDRVNCPWVRKNGELCGKEMQLEQLGRHLSTTHICGTVYQCPHCREFDNQTRRDATQRHIRAVHKSEPAMPDEVRTILLGPDMSPSDLRVTPMPDQASTTDDSSHDSHSPRSDSSLDLDGFLEWSADGVSRHSEAVQARAHDVIDTQMEPPIEVLRDSAYKPIMYNHHPDDDEDEDMIDAAPEIDELADDDDDIPMSPGILDLN